MNIEQHPIERDLQTSMPLLIDLLDEHFAVAPSLIDEQLEQVPKTIRYTELLASVMFNRATHEDWLATYRAFHFGAMVSGLAGVTTEKFSIAQDFPDHHLDGDLRDHLIKDCSDYLANNQSLRAITTAYLPSIDPSFERTSEIQTIVALTARQVERGYQQQQLEQAFSQ